MATVSGMSSGSTDYQALFGNLSASASKSAPSSNNLLADYASIKNGSYAKIAKAYYGKTSGSKKTAAATKEEAAATIKSNNSVKAAADSLKSSISALTDSKSLFTDKVETTDKDGKKTTDYDYEKIYQAVKSFVDDYNKVIKEGGESDNKSILRNTLSMVNATKKNSTLLSDVGVTINEDNTLSLDKDTIKKANIHDLRSMFSGMGSYAESLSSKASSISNKANYENNKLSNYTAGGTFSAADAVGNIYDSSY